MADKGRKRCRSSNSSGASPGIMIRPPQPRPPSPVEAQSSNFIANASHTLYGPPPQTPNTPNAVFDGSYIYSPNIIQGAYSSTPDVPHIQLTPSTMIQPSPTTKATNEQDNVISDIYEQLRKLDSLPEIFKQLQFMNEQFVNLSSDLQNAKRTLNEHSERIEQTENNNDTLNQRLATVELERYDLWDENARLREDILRLQAQSMKENLIISGIPEGRAENTETVVKNFIAEKLEIPDEVDFQAVHRLKHKPGGGPRSIVVRFEKRKDKTRVLKASPKLRGQDIHVFEQFPAEISERRKKLIPNMKELRAKGYFTELRYDKLFVNGRIFDPTRTYDVYMPPRQQDERQDEQASQDNRVRAPRDNRNTNGDRGAL